MGRIISVIAFVALSIAATFNELAVIVFPIILVTGLVFGTPIALALRKWRWTQWWQSAIGGMLCSAPLILYYLGLNPGRREWTGLADSVYLLLPALAGGLVFWLLVVFRNSYFGTQNQAWPMSILAAPIVLVALNQYRVALEPVFLFGCITHYEELAEPTPWRHSRVAIATDEGEMASATLTVGYSNPDVVGNCASISKRRTALLQDYFYALHSTIANGCNIACPNTGARP